MLDAPCTGLGQRPRLCFEDAAIKETAVYQKSLLEAACKSLKWGGRLIYSTCTIAEEGTDYIENQENIKWAVEHLPLVVEDQNLDIGERSSPFQLTQFFSPIIYSGFFIAQLKKIKQDH